MNETLKRFVLELTNAENVESEALIQPLWNDYGTLSRVYLKGGTRGSVIIKAINIPHVENHPRGFSGRLGRERKLRSYEVETSWYEGQNQALDDAVKTPLCLGVIVEGSTRALILEDLGELGYSRALHRPTLEQACSVLRWLAMFHARFLGEEGKGLWEQGTYWHLETRPDELSKIVGSDLFYFASILDVLLRNDPYPTLVHGDAKLANFCFTQDASKVAGVDFQYVGRGSAMKDVAYLIGSCFSGPECEALETQLLDSYFGALRDALGGDMDVMALEQTWRDLYSIAWADFERFLAGWSPSHHKRSKYSHRQTEMALEHCQQTLLKAARKAALAAGDFIRSHWKSEVATWSKDSQCTASSIVTEIDERAQEIILDALASTLDSFDLGCLAEEEMHDESRQEKHAFWAIDPLDGTVYFAQGREGFAVSIGLVLKGGASIIGVVYDPVTDRLYESIRGRGVWLNGKPMAKPSERPSGRRKRFADESFRHSPDFEKVKERFDVQFAGGAVLNSIQLLHEAESVYIKQPKNVMGGCAIWDLAAVSLMIQELGGQTTHYDGSPLHLNRSGNLYFNDVGISFVGPPVD